jgi:hypothetical protein
MKYYDYDGYDDRYEDIHNELKCEKCNYRCSYESRDARFLGKDSVFSYERKDSFYFGRINHSKYKGYDYRLNFYCNHCVQICKCNTKFIYEKDDVRICSCTPCKRCTTKCKCGSNHCLNCNVKSCKCIQNIIKKYIINDVARIIFDYNFTYNERWVYWF